MKFGTNFNTTANNAGGPDPKLPIGYFFKGNFTVCEAFEGMDHISRVASIKFFRTFIWPAEHSKNDTPWLHIPITSNEIDAIREYIGNAFSLNCHVELVWGPLWESLWNCIECNPDTRPNQFTNIQDLLLAHTSSMRQLYSMISQYNNWSIDLWNEKSIYDQEDDLFIPLYKEACGIFADRPKTFSVMIGMNGEYDDAKKMINRALNNLCPVPDYLELHWNETPDKVIYDKCEKVIKEINKMGLNRPIFFGEINNQLEFDTISKIEKAIKKINHPASWPLPIIAWWQRSAGQPNF